MSQFDLHSQLEADTHFVTDLELSRLLLMDDARYPWVILVPRRRDLTEMHQLDKAAQSVLMEEITRLSETMQTCFQAGKMNVGALGNMVPQLHIHVIARNPGDEAWPGPVWGVGKRKPYGDRAGARVQEIRNLLDS